MTPPARPAGRGAGEVRLIGGRFKRSKLPVPDRPGLRPTPDRVRETLFNWLGQQLDGWRVLDAFAGSGALGFEAASRGAVQVVLVESDPVVARGLASTAHRLGAGAVQVHAGDALAWMKAATPASFELVLLDPPFGSALVAPALQAAVPLVAAGGLVYLETSADTVVGLPDRWVLHRELRAGAVVARLLTKAAD